MKTIKTKIAISDLRSRKREDWGKAPSDAYHVNLFFTSDSDDMGIGTDIDFIDKGDNTKVDYTPLIDKLGNSLSYNFMNGGQFSTDITIGNVRHPDKKLNDYFVKGGNVSGYTNDRLDSVKSYDINEKFKVGFDMSSSEVIDYKGSELTSVDRVTANVNLKPITYVEGANKKDPLIGTIGQGSGILLITDESKNRYVRTNGDIIEIDETKIYFKSEGFNETNTTLSATTKEEYLFGITREPNVESDVFIDRGIVFVKKSHIQLSEIKNMGSLINYGNGYYNLK